MLLALHDGTASSRAQSTALAKALGPGVIEALAPWPRARSLRWLPSWGLIMANPLARAMDPQWRAQMDDLVAQSAQKEVKAVVACGRRTAPAACAVKFALMARNVQIMDPRCGRWLGERWFDAIVTPKHDGVKGSNVHATTGSITWVSREALAQQRENTVENCENGVHSFVGDVENGGNALVMLCGGHTGRRKMEVDVVMRDVDHVMEKSAHLFERWMAVGSRRTPAELLDELRRRGFKVWEAPTAWKTRDVTWVGGMAQGMNPYRDCLAFGSAFMVTADSVSMVSDACSTGKAVVLLKNGVDGSEGGGRGKLYRFIKAVQEAESSGVVDYFDVDNLALERKGLCDTEAAVAFILERMKIR